jgi:hypothetical protein
LAGLYALACQLDYDITPDMFWDEISIEIDGKTYQLWNIADPKELMRKISGNRQE